MDWKKSPNTSAFRAEWCNRLFEILKLVQPNETDEKNRELAEEVENTIFQKYKTESKYKEVMQKKLDKVKKAYEEIQAQNLPQVQSMPNTSTDSATSNQVTSTKTSTLGSMENSSGSSLTITQPSIPQIKPNNQENSEIVKREKFLKASLKICEELLKRTKKELDDDVPKTVHKFVKEFFTSYRKKRFDIAENLSKCLDKYTPECPNNASYETFLKPYIPILEMYKKNFPIFHKKPNFIEEEFLKLSNFFLETNKILEFERNTDIIPPEKMRSWRNVIRKCLVYCKDIYSLCLKEHGINLENTIKVKNVTPSSSSSTPHSTSGATSSADEKFKTIEISDRVDDLPDFDPSNNMTLLPSNDMNHIGQEVKITAINEKKNSLFDKLKKIEKICEQYLPSSETQKKKDIDTEIQRLIGLMEELKKINLSRDSVKIDSSSLTSLFEDNGKAFSDSDIHEYHQTSSKFHSVRQFNDTKLYYGFDKTKQGIELNADEGVPTNPCSSYFTNIISKIRAKLNYAVYDLLNISSNSNVLSPLTYDETIVVYTQCREFLDFIEKYRESLGGINCNHFSSSWITPVDYTYQYGLTSFTSGQRKGYFSLTTPAPEPSASEKDIMSDVHHPNIKDVETYSKIIAKCMKLLIQLLEKENVLSHVKFVSKEIYMKPSSSSGVSEEQGILHLERDVLGILYSIFPDQSVLETALKIKESKGYLKIKELFKNHETHNGYEMMLLSRFTLVSTSFYPSKITFDVSKKSLSSLIINQNAYFPSRLSLTSSNLLTTNKFQNKQSIPRSDLLYELYRSREPYDDSYEDIYDDNVDSMKVENIALEKESIYNCLNISSLISDIVALIAQVDH